MTKFQTKLTTAFATGAVLLNALAPLAAADTTLTVTGNGSGSTSTAAVTATTTTSVVQNNTSNIVNNVNVSSNTGGNSADNNTGGNVGVQSGNATSDISVSNAANNNAASVTNCNCNNDVNATISGNGTGSQNGVAVNNASTTSLFQTNVANVANNVNVDSKTGHNSADNNTGGNVGLRSGDVNTTVDLSTVANANSAQVGGAHAAGAGNAVNAVISGNGSYSENAVSLDLGNDVLVEQVNAAQVANNVDVTGLTGGNSADDNTGGNVALRSGNAGADLGIDNMVNFNGADLDNCACMTDLTAKIAGNGTESANGIAYAGDNTVAAFQTNASALGNNADVTNKTGWNSADDNTGSVLGANDPALLSGNTNATLDLNNAGNQNTLGEGTLGTTLSNVNFTFNWAGMMAWFMSH